MNDDEPEEEGEMLLDSVKAFFKVIRAVRVEINRQNVVLWKTPTDVGVFCPTCGGKRRAFGRLLYEGPKGNSNSVVGLPALCQFRCMQCETVFFAVAYSKPSATGYALLPTVPGGLTTPNTPPAVAYYLDQASRAASVGAVSAAMAMYRGALEQLLFEQGYKSGMLGAKISALEKDIAGKTAAKWAMDLDPAFLHVIKDLGNGAIHPNGGDITKQEAFDAGLLSNVKITFAHLLQDVYEVERQRAARLAALKAKAAVVK